jgi:exodeoxyribonuclease VII small subunit
MPAKKTEQRKPAREEQRQGAPGEMRQGAPGEMRQGAPGEMRQGAPGEMRQGAPGEMRQGAPGFEQRLERLEQLAVRLREGNIPLEEAVALFEEGMKLSKTLEKELARVERRVEILTREPGETDDPGAEPALELFPELGDEEKD